LIRILNIDTSDFEVKYPPNPHAATGDTSSHGNDNFVAYSVTSSADLWQQTGLAVHVVRLLSITLGMLTLIGIYAIARQVIPKREDAALIAVAMVAFNPQFLFINSSVTNDTLVTTLTTLSLAAMFWQMRTGITFWRVLLLAVLLALDARSKASGLILYPVVAMGMLWAVWQQRFPFLRVLLYSIIGICILALLAGSWYWNNWVMFRDISATSQIIATMGVQRTSDLGAVLASEMGGMYESFWGVFGWFNLASPPIFYAWTVLLVGFSAVGLLWAGYCHRFRVKQENAVYLGLLLLFGVIFGASWWSFHLKINAAQGRLIFPMISVLAIIAGYGLANLPRPVTVILLLGLMLGAIILPVTVIAPAYAVDTTVPTLPDNAVSVQIREPWREPVCLNVWTTPAQLKADSSVEIDVWWQKTCLIEASWSVFIHMVDIEAEPCVPGVTDYILAQFDSMPQRGNLPFPAMQTNQLYYEHYSLPVPSGVDLSRLHDVYLGLYDAVGKSGLRAAVTSDAFTDRILTGKCSPDVIRYHFPALDKPGS
jgi:4-amino-4-deoxy-L-arabinose transferase-like glycosyltransferase